jgi:hypothetical protein
VAHGEQAVAEEVKYPLSQVRAVIDPRAGGLSLEVVPPAAAELAIVHDKTLVGVAVQDPQPMN